MELRLLVAQLRSKRDDGQLPFSPDSLGRGVGCLGDEYKHGGGLPLVAMLPTQQGWSTKIPRSSQGGWGL